MHTHLMSVASSAHAFATASAAVANLPTMDKIAQITSEYECMYMSAGICIYSYMFFVQRFGFYVGKLIIFHISPY